MIVRKGGPSARLGAESQVAELGAFQSRRYSAAGGLMQFGAYVEDNGAPVLVLAMPPGGHEG